MLHDEIARGGMASVHIGRLLGPVGFARTVAIKRLHAHYAKNPDVVAMFLQEARLAACVRHAHVASVLDVVQVDGEIFLIMDYVHGESLARLWTPDEPIDVRLAAAVLVQALLGLHAAHEARDERGNPLGIVHRDVSPQNILVGEDGVTRVVDFGIAKALAQLGGSTTGGLVKGKLTYMAPERLAEAPHIDRRVDVFAAGVVLWELLTGRRLFQGTDAQVVKQVLHHQPEPPSTQRPGLGDALDRVCMRALATDPDARYGTAREMALALEQAVAPASALEVSTWIEARAGAALRTRAGRIAEIERAAAGVSHAGRDGPELPADGTRPLIVPLAPMAAVTEASGVAAQAEHRAAESGQSRPGRAGGWLLLAAACVIAAAAAGLLLGERAQEPSVVQVDAPGHAGTRPRAEPQRTAAAASANGRDMAAADAPDHHGSARDPAASRADAAVEDQRAISHAPAKVAGQARRDGTSRARSPKRRVRASQGTAPGISRSGTNIDLGL